jgi:hypothetical protein
MSRFRAHHLLAALPAAGMLGGLGFANRMQSYVLGLPFLLFWLVAWVVLTAAIMALIGAIDRRRDSRDARDAGGMPGARRDAEGGR